MTDERRNDEHAAPLELREQLLGSVDTLATVLEGVATSCLRWWQDNQTAWAGLGVGSWSRTDEERLAADKISGTFEQFKANYFDDDGGLRHEAFYTLAQAVHEKFQIITLADMCATAKRVIADTPNDDVVQLYIDDSAAETLVSSELISNSVALMAKLVIIAAGGPERIELVAGVDEIRAVHGRFVHVDDAVYSGTKISRIVASVARRVASGADFQVYLSGARPQGLESIRREVMSGHFLSISSDRELLSIPQLFADDPIAMQYFTVEAIANQVRQSYGSAIRHPDNVLRCVARRMDEQGLAITAYRTPDSFSLPWYIARALPGGGGRRQYPTASELDAQLTAN